MGCFLLILCAWWIFGAKILQSETVSQVDSFLPWFLSAVCDAINVVLFLDAQSLKKFAPSFEDIGGELHWFANRHNVCCFVSSL